MPRACCAFGICACILSCKRAHVRMDLGKYNLFYFFLHFLSLYTIGYYRLFMRLNIWNITSIDYAFINVV